MKNISSFPSWLLLAAITLLLFACEEDPDVPTLPDNQVFLNYDGDNLDAPQLPANTYEAGVRFPAGQMNQYVGNRLVAVQYFIQSLPGTCELRIYIKSDNDTPDSLLYNANVRAELGANSWNVHTLSTPLDISSEDLWITLLFSHNGEQRTVGCDQGPAATNGDWLMDAADNQWIPLRNRSTLNINWNIRGVIDTQ